MERKMTISLETSRLVIRSTRKEDADFCIDIWSDEKMGKYLSDPSREKAGDIYNNWKETVEVYDGCYYFVAVLKEAKTLIATCSLVPSDSGVWDLGYCVHQDYWRQGYATEILKELINFCALQGGNRVTASVAKENIASNALLIKLGFNIEKEGKFKKTGTDIVFEEYIYSYELKENK
jgi:RimJ/RimL family protein N-acetyltransferase